MSRLDLLYTCPQLTISASRNLLVFAWLDAPTVDVMREVARVARTVAKKHPSGSGLMNLFLAGTPRFTDEVRAEVVKIDRDPTLFPQGSARVILLPGLAGTAVRVFLNTVTLMARQPIRPVQAFGGVSQAAAWLAPKLESGGQAWRAEEIVALTTEYLERRSRIT